MLWFDRGGMDTEAYQALSAELGAARPRVLAWGEGPHGRIIALPDRLVGHLSDGWHHVYWHEIIAGGWDPRRGTLSWRTCDGEHQVVELSAAGDIPDLFRERVASSIVASEHLTLSGGRGVTVAARKNSADRRAGVMLVPIPDEGTDMADPEVAALVEQVIARMRADLAIR